MKQFFKELFDYGHHFNQKLSGALVDNANIASKRAVALFSHIINAHQIWNQRIHPVDAPFRVWEVHPVSSFKSLDTLNYQQSLHIINQLELNVKIHYSNTKGQVFTNSIQDILFHVINHSTYHRGQLATEFKILGLNPLVTDFIFYKR